jgi:hypothetical protein
MLATGTDETLKLAPLARVPASAPFELELGGRPMMVDGTLEMIDGRPVLRFERPLAYPIEQVWRARSAFPQSSSAGSRLRPTGRRQRARRSRRVARAVR